MDRHHHHDPLPPLSPMLSEADAVVREAEALERETRRETAALVLYDRGYRIEPDLAEDQLQYLRLREAAAAVVEISLTMQIPQRDDPYAALGSKIHVKARNLLAEIEAGDLCDRTRAEEPPPKS